MLSSLRFIMQALRVALLQMMSIAAFATICAIHPCHSVVSTALGSHCKLPALQVIPATLAMMKGTLEDALESEAAWEQVITAHSLSCLGGQTENNRNPVIVGNQKPGSLKMVECKSDFCFKTVWPQHTPTAAAKSGTCQRSCS